MVIFKYYIATYFVWTLFQVKAWQSYSVMTICWFQDSDIHRYNYCKSLMATYLVITIFQLHITIHLLYATSSIQQQHACYNSLICMLQQPSCYNTLLHMQQQHTLLYFTQTCNSNFLCYNSHTSHLYRNLLPNGQLFTQQQ